MKISTVFFSCLVLALSAFAQGRIIISHPEFKLPDKGVKLQNVDARVDLKNGVANVTLEQEFRNQSSFNLEGEYLLSLQPGAQVYDFHLYIDGKKTQGQILDAAEARKVYNDIVRRMRDPALMEYAGYGLFKTHIFPIAAGQDRKIEVAYSEIIQKQSGTFSFELPIRQSGEGSLEKFHLIINLQAEGPIANIYSPTHDISVDRKGDRNATISVEQTNMAGDKNFVLYYSLGNQEINGTLLTFRPRTDQDGYFLLLASPQVGELDQPPIPQDVIFVIDVSGSMQGEKIEQAKGALKFCVNALSEKDRFDIVNFSSSIQNFQEKLDYAGKERKENATYFIEKMRASGGTNLNEALLRGLQLAEANKERMTTLILLTDGLPTEGQTDVTRILGNIRQENKNEIRIFCFGVGYDVNTFLLDKMSRENHGSVTYIKPGENLEKSISGFFAKITEPVLTNPQIKFDTSNLYDIYPQTLPDIFKDDRVAVFGRYRNPGDLKITLQGNQAGHPKKFSYSFKLEQRNRENEFISKLWANRKVDHLLDQIRFNGENPELVESIKKLGLEFGIVTPYTSYLVTEEKKELAFVQNQIARGSTNTTILRLESARELRDQKAGEDEESVGSSVFYDALISQSMPAATSSGKGAVMSSRIRKKMATADKPSEMIMTIRRIGTKTFRLQEGIWREVGLENKSGSKKSIIAFSDDYFKLGEQEPEIQKIFSLGERVQFEWNDTIYEVVTQ